MTGVTLTGKILKSKAMTGKGPEKQALQGKKSKANIGAIHRHGRCHRQDWGNRLQCKHTMQNPFVGRATRKG